jgi:hypothetical protein
VLICREPKIESWIPNAARGDASLPAFRLRCDGWEVANAVDSTTWERNPVPVVVCQECMDPECNAHYVRVSRLGGHVLFTPPESDDLPWPLFLRKRGALCMETETWDALAARFSDMPRAVDLETTTRGDVARAWLLQGRGVNRQERIEDIPPLFVDRLLACDSLLPEEAVEVARRIVEWVNDAPDAPVEGRLISPVQPECLYVDGPDNWAAFARLPDGWTLAFGDEMALEPAIVPA